MDIIVRPATIKDAEAILGIYTPYITDTYISFETEVPAIKEFSERIENIMKNYPYLVCEVDGKVVGYAYASKHRERAAYKYSADVSVYIAAAYKRRGIGKALYVKLFELLKEQGIYTVYAGITLPNNTSIGLHKSMGFNEVGVYHKVGFKHGRWHDVAWFEKVLREYGNPERKDTKATIRLAVSADASDMAEVLMRSWEVAYKDIIPADFIREKNATRLDMFKRTLPENIYTYVIQYDGKTVGIMRVAPPQDDDAGDDWYEVHSIYLHPDCFNQGIGTQAMEFAFDIARGLGRTDMVVWVFAENINTIKFYEKCGFIPDGKTKMYNCGKDINSIRMRRGL